MIILDTNAISELLRPAPEPRVEQWLSAQDGLNVYLISISEAELRYGLAIMGNGMRRTALVDAEDRILCEDLAGRILPFDSDAAQAYATIAALPGDGLPRLIARSHPLPTPVVPPLPHAIRLTSRVARST